MSQARQMDRGEIEVEEVRRVRAKRVPVLPTDKEKDENDDSQSVRDRRFQQVVNTRVAGATSDHGPSTLCPRRAHGTSVDTEDPQCGGAKCFTKVQRLVWPGRCVAQARCWVCHSDTRQPSMGRTRRKDDGREDFEAFASFKQHERECCERHRNVSDSQ